MLGMNFVEYAFLPAMGTCGGIIVAAQQPDVRIDDVHIGCFSVTVWVHSGTQDGHPSWWLTTVYGPQDDNDKVLFLEELSAVRDACPGPWAIIGDFNLILDEADKNNAATQEDSVWIQLGQPVVISHRDPNKGFYCRIWHVHFSMENRIAL